MRIASSKVRLIAALALIGTAGHASAFGTFTPASAATLRALLANAVVTPAATGSTSGGSATVTPSATGCGVTASATSTNTNGSSSSSVSLYSSTSPTGVCTTGGTATTRP